MTETEKNKLWEGYSRHRTAEVREKLIIEYAPLVKLVAGRLSMYLGYTVEYDDLVGYGVLGLIDAIDKFDYGKGIKFETYASLRIRGAILDQIRKMDWIPRTLRQKQKKIDNAIKEIEALQGRNATDEEIIELYWQRDEYAIQATSDKYGKFLYKIAYNILHDNLDCEECRNDTYLEVWNSIPPQRPWAFRAFISKIMRNIAIDKYYEKTNKKRIYACSRK